MNNREKFLMLLIESGLIIGGQWLVLSSVENTSGIWEWIISSVALLGIIPIITIKYLFKEDLKKYFITTRGEKGSWLMLLLLSLIFLGLMGLIVVQLDWWEHMLASYWLISGSASLVIFIDLVLMPFVIIANEIFFRGLAMSLIARWLGSLWGILGQSFLAVFYTFFFLEDIGMEKILILFVLNLFLGYVCFRKRTIVISALVHWIVYLSIDLTVLYQIYQIR